MTDDNKEHNGETVAIGHGKWDQNDKHDQSDNNDHYEKEDSNNKDKEDNADKMDNNDKAGTSSSFRSWSSLGGLLVRSFIL